MVHTHGAGRYTNSSGDLDELCSNTIRTLAMDAVQQANPGTRYADGAGSLAYAADPVPELAPATLPGPTETASSSQPAMAPCSSTCCTLPATTDLDEITLPAVGL
jgi:hypothetical protein